MGVAPRASRLAPRADETQFFSGVRVAWRIDERAVAATDQCPREQRDRVLGSTVVMICAGAPLTVQRAVIARKTANSIKLKAESPE